MNSTQPSIDPKLSVWRPIRTLLWERWRATRWPILGSWLLAAIAALCATTSTDTITILGYLFYLTLIASSPVLVAVVFVKLLLDTDSRGAVIFAFPRRWFRFPLPTWVLVLIHIGYSMSALASLTTAICAIAWKYSSVPYTANELVGFWFCGTISILSSFAAAQTILWQTKGKSSYIVLAAAIAAAFGILWASLLCSALFVAMRNMNSQFENAFIWAVLKALLVVPLVLGWITIVLDRRGELWTWSPRIIPRIPQFPTRTHHFQSAFRAQVWFEFRRLGLYLPALTAGIIAVAGAFTYFESRWAVFFWPEFLPPCLANLLVLHMGERERQASDNNISFVHPCSTATLGLARNLALGLSALCGTAIVVPYEAFIRGSIHFERSSLFPALTIEATGSSTFIYAAFYFVTAWFLLRFFLFAFLFLVARTALSLPLLVSRNAASTQVLAATIPVWISIVAVGLLVFVIDRKLLTSRAAATLAIAWSLVPPIGAAAWLVQAGAAISVSESLLTAYCLYGVTSCVLLPFVLTPLWLSRQRNR
jgi:hypothetical protein